jgi:hypothetical protein
MKGSLRAAVFLISLSFLASTFCLSSQKSTPLHVGLVSIGLQGHTKPMLYIAQELLTQGHKPHFFVPQASV